MKELKFSKRKQLNPAGTVEVDDKTKDAVFKKLSAIVWSNITNIPVEILMEKEHHHIKTKGAHCEDRYKLSNMDFLTKSEHAEAHGAKGYIDRRPPELVKRLKHFDCLKTE